MHGKRVSQVFLIIGSLASQSLLGTISYQEGRLLTAGQVQQIARAHPEQSDLAVMLDGTEIQGVITEIPTLVYSFGTLLFSPNEVLAVSIVREGSKIKGQIITRDGQSYVAPLHAAAIKFESAGKKTLSLDPKTVSYLLVQDRGKVPAPEDGPFFDLELKNGDRLSAAVLSDEVRLSDGLEEFTLNPKDFIDMHYEGCLKGTYQDKEGWREEINYVFIRDKDLQVKLAKGGKLLSIPWGQVVRIKAIEQSREIAQSQFARKSKRDKNISSSQTKTLREQIDEANFQVNNWKMKVSEEVLKKNALEREINQLKNALEAKEKWVERLEKSKNETQTDLLAKIKQTTNALENEQNQVRLLKEKLRGAVYEKASSQAGDYGIAELKQCLQEKTCSVESLHDLLAEKENELFVLKESYHDALKEYEESQNQIDVLTEVLEAYRQKAHSLDSEAGSLRASYGNAEEEKQAIQDQLQEISERLHSREQVISELQKQLQQAEEFAKGQQENIVEKQASFDSVQQAYAQMQEELASVKQDFAAQSLELEALKNMSADHESELSGNLEEMKNYISQKEEEIQNLQRIIHAQVLETEHVQQENKELQEKLSYYEQELEKVGQDGQIVSSMSVLDTLLQNVIIGTVEEKQHRIALLESDFEEQGNNFAKNSEELAAITEEISALKQELYEKNYVEQELAHVREALAGIQGELTQVWQHKVELQHALEQEKAAGNKECAFLERELEKSKEALERLAQEQQMEGRFQEDIALYEQELEEARAKNSQLEADLHKAQQQYVGQEEELAQAQEEIASLERARNFASEQVADLQEQLHKAQQQHVGLEEELAQAQEEIASLERARTDASEQVANLQEQLHKVQQQHVGQEEELAQAQEEIASLERARTDASEQVADLQEQLHKAQQQRVGQEDELAQAQEEIVNLRHFLDVAKNRANQLEQWSIELQNNVKELEKVQDAYAALEQLLVTENEKNRTLEDIINQNHWQESIEKQNIQKLEKALEQQVAYSANLSEQNLEKEKLIRKIEKNKEQLEKSSKETLQEREEKWKENQRQLQEQLDQMESALAKYEQEKAVLEKESLEAKEQTQELEDSLRLLLSKYDQEKKRSKNLEFQLRSVVKEMRYSLDSDISENQ